MIKPVHSGWSKSTFTVVSTLNTEFILVLSLINVLFSMQTTINLLLTHPAYIYAYTHICTHIYPLLFDSSITILKNLVGIIALNSRNKEIIFKRKALKTRPSSQDKQKDTQIIKRVHYIVKAHTACWENTGAGSAGCPQWGTARSGEWGLLGGVLWVDRDCYGSDFQCKNSSFPCS